MVKERKKLRRWGVERKMMLKKGKERMKDKKGILIKKKKAKKIMKGNLNIRGREKMMRK